MLTKTSPVHLLFAEFGNTDVISKHKYLAYDILRTTFEVVNGKAEIESFFNMQSIWIPYLEKKYYDWQVQIFYDILKTKITVSDMVMPSYPKYEQTYETSEYGSSDGRKLPNNLTAVQAWALGFLTAELFYKTT